MYKIIVDMRLPGECWQHFTDCEVIGPENPSFTREEFLEKARGCDAAVVLYNNVDDELLDALPSLKAVTSFGAGYDYIDVDACTRHGVVACHIPDSVREPTAEYTIALLLATVRTIPWRDRQLRENPGYSWQMALYPSWIAMGKTLGIVGMGRIGSSVARRAAALDMTVVYYDPHRLSPEEEEKLDIVFMPLDELLKAADIVTLHVPLTPETTGMIGARELALMKPTAHLINMARGPVVDEDALLDALEQKRIAGAGIDVFKDEPHINPRFKALDNVVLTPHFATDPLDVRKIQGEHCARNLLAALRGETPPNILNPQVLDRQ
ncbi:MAG: NAD(P)-dependent oxidoreductase [Christensenellales bacterium]|jgi:glyoxylate reductase